MRQQAFELKTWGGKRKGAGRKPAAGRDGIRHDARDPVRPSQPVHVTMRVAEHVWNLRSQRSFRIVDAALHAVQARRDFRVVHFSVLGNHLHLIVEADGTVALANGMRALSIRVALRLNAKCLRVLDGKPIKKGHEVSRLFDGLNPETQARITSAWRQRFHPNAAATPADFRLSIEPLDAVFVEWRYVFESPSLVSDARPLDAALTAVQQAILELRPDWFPPDAVIQDVVASEFHTIMKIK
jgi:REP element-mobilizing transposase RayT